MNDISLEQLLTLKQTDENALATAEKLLRHSPEGDIIFRTVRNTPRYYHSVTADPSTAKRKRSEIYLGEKQSMLVYALTRKRYLKTLCPPLRKEIAALDRFIKAYHPEEKYEALNSVPDDLHEHITPLFTAQSEKCQIWQAQAFESNPFPIDPESCYTTARGDSVRSRAECILCDKVNRRLLAYHYEEKLVLGRNEIYPDLTIMHPQTCELYFLEYFGMMDNPAYAKNAMEKIHLYYAAGLGPRLITIFDSREAPFSFNQLDAILDSYFGK